MGSTQPQHVIKNSFASVPGENDVKLNIDCFMDIAPTH